MSKQVNAENLKPHDGPHKKGNPKAYTSNSVKHGDKGKSKK